LSEQKDIITIFVFILSILIVKKMKEKLKPVIGHWSQAWITSPDFLLLFKLRRSERLKRPKLFF